MKYFSGSDSITRRVLGMLGFISALYIVLAFVILRFSVFESFARLEAEMVAEDAQRVRQILAGELQILDGINQEWSAWNDTYDFMLGDNPEYADDYLYDGTLVSSNIDMMALFQRDGTPVWALMLDRSTGEVLDIDSVLDNLDMTKPPFDSLGPVKRTVSGALSSAHGPLLMVAKPVLRTDASGPPVGVLITGRRLTPGLAAKLSDRVGVPLRVYDAGAIPSGLAGAWRALASSSSTLHTETRELSVASFQVQPDIWGRPAALLEAATPRRVTSIGSETVLAALVMLMVAVVLFSLALWWFLDRSVITPIRSLRDHVSTLRTQGDLARRLGLNRRDEVGALAEAFDALTERLQCSMEESEQARATAVTALQAKSEFLARMSHEIRTPMNGVLGMTSIMLESNDVDDEQRHALETIYQSGRSLLAIIDDILDLAKIEAGKLRVVEEVADVRQLVGDCLTLLRPLATQADLALKAEIDQALAPAYLVDAGRVRQVLTNLVGNAVKFTPAGSVAVAVYPVPAGLRFAVADTGIGIQPENLHRVFDSFAQEDSRRSRRFGGTGLGLTISKQLVEMMGGTIGAESEPDRGSTFWFDLPLVPALPAVRSSQAVAAPSVRSTPLARLGLSVLVVEDNPVNRWVAEQMLRKMACEVTLATQGEEALEAVRRETFDLILMDCEMPVMDGYEAVRRIRAWETELGAPAMPIVALTANVLREDRQRCLDAGMDDVLTKPVTLDGLSATLSSYRVRGDQPAKSVR